MAKILKSGSVVPMASLGRFAAGISVVVAGAFMAGVWASSITASSASLIAGLLGSWPVGIFGVGAVAAAGIWLAGGRSAPMEEHPAGAEAINLGGSVEMANPVMVSPQVAFTMSRVK